MNTLDRKRIYKIYSILSEIPGVRNLADLRAKDCYYNNMEFIRNKLCHALMATLENDADRFNEYIQEAENYITDQKKAGWYKP